tara:strand:- start:581 stop:1000 length:420 start_codon:yes stop_codon:yes gene_type:complete
MKLKLQITPTFKWVMVSMFIVMAMCLHVTPVLAHAQLIKTEPARRAVLAKAPTQVRLWFNEEIEAAYVSLSVFDADKKPVTDAIPSVAPDDTKSVILPLPELAAGKYSVKFRVLSVDGHVVDSSFDYTIKFKNKHAQEK